MSETTITGVQLEIIASLATIFIVFGNVDHLLWNHWIMQKTAAIPLRHRLDPVQIIR